jgi:hypothetical protein
MNIEKGISFGITNDYVAASSAFTGLQEIIVYVEGYKDVPFWTEIFRSHSLKRTITVNEISKGQKGNGKGTIISLIRAGQLKLGTSLIVAIDSDYDYFLDSNNDIYSQNFVFQTYCHSIENFYFDPTDSITHCCKAANCYEFEKDFRCISEVFHDWSKNNINDFLLYLKNKDPNLITKVEQSLNTLNMDYKSSLNSTVSIDSDLLSKGLCQDNLFFFIRGHNLEEKCKELFNRVITDIMRRKKEQIMTNNLRAEETNTQLVAEFGKAKQSIEPILRNRDISKNPQFEKINSDIDLFKTFL